MNAGAIVLAGAIGLMGCTTIGHHRAEDGRNGGFPPTSSESQPPVGDNAPKEPYVRNLPKDAEKAIAQVGIKDILFLAAVDYHGNVRFLKPDTVRYRKMRLPQQLDLQPGIKSLILLPYKGSDCVGIPSLHSEGGMLMAFCDPSGVF